MVYLLESAYIVDRKTKETRICMKIGYASNVDERFKAYGTPNNPTVYRLSEREGSLVVESLFHYYYKDRMLPLDTGREWMEYDESIIEEFNTISIKELLRHRFSEDSEKHRFLNIILDHFYSDQTENIFLGLYKAVSSEYLFMRDYYRGAYFSRYDFSALYNSLKSILSPIPESTEDNFIEELITAMPDRYFPELDHIILSSRDNVEEKLSQNPELLERFNKIYQTCQDINTFDVIMKEVCSILFEPQWKDILFISDFYWLPFFYKNYINLLGIERIRALSYVEVNIKREINILKGDSDITLQIKEKFTVGERYKLSYIKEELRLIYSGLGLTKTPKATDILSVFEVKSVRFYDPKTGARDAGYEIISIK